MSSIADFCDPFFNRYNPTKKYRRLVMWTEHNKYLPDGYVERLKIKYGKNKNLAKAHLYGEFCDLLEGSAYPDFDEYSDHVQDVALFGLPTPSTPIKFSWDWNVNPLAWVACSRVYLNMEYGRRLKYIFHGESSGQSSQIEDGVIEFALQYPVHLYEHTEIRIHGDATGHRRDVRKRGDCFDEVIEQMKKLGYKNVIDVSPDSNPLVPVRVARVNSLFYSDHIIIAKHLRNLIKSYNGTAWKQGTFELAKPQSDQLTHWSDASDYVLFDLSELDSKKLDLPTIVF